MLIVNVTWLSWVIFAVVGYYGLLLAVPATRQAASMVNGRRRRVSGSPRRPFIVLVIPAHNEEAVIGQTLTTLEALDYPDRLVLVMDDGSTDVTSQVASMFTFSGRVLVVKRDREIAGRGKGAVLNHAFALVSEMVASRDPRLRGRSADEVVVGVMDADGQLEADALSKVAPFFTGRRNAGIGGVQIGVRIANATTNLLTRMQDFEFVGSAAIVQSSRNSFGSVGLGGNGQFTRLSALKALGRDPWTACLTEDLDLSLSLAEIGWDIRFCSDTFVAQQGLTRLWPLLRQRTRWIQGHYQCWRHLPLIWGSRHLRLRAKLDLSVDLLMVLFVLVVFSGLMINLLAWAGLLVPVDTSLDAITNPELNKVAQLMLSVGPLAGFVCVYQRHTATPLRWWELPAAGLLFALYAYVFVFSQAWACVRLLARRGSWAKTPRVSAEIAVNVAS